MSDTSYPYYAKLTRAENNKALIGLLISGAIWLTVFSGGFVIAEPAPYDLLLAGIIGISAFCGLKIPKAIAPLIGLLILFNIGGLITLTITPGWSDYVLYVATSFFLAFNTIFFAAIIAARPEVLNLIFSAYVVAAVLTGLLGILSYFGVMPGSELFLRYGRAKGAFQDPNVFAPYLCPPALYCLYQILTKPVRQSAWPAVALLLIALALFLSFSRAGWGMFVIGALLLVLSLMIANPSGKFRIRIILLTIFSISALIFSLMIALQFDAVKDIFVTRAQLVQDYDGARLGRFARHWIGFGIAAENPMGIGILQFGKILTEDTHNIWLKALLEYSWLGFAAYITLLVWTLVAGFKILFRNRPWQPFLLCTYIMFIGHILIGNVIDTDHWRHFFLLLGIIWGCIAAEAKIKQPNHT